MHFAWCFVLQQLESCVLVGSRDFTPCCGWLVVGVWVLFVFFNEAKGNVQNSFVLVVLRNETVFQAFGSFPLQYEC